MQLSTECERFSMCSICVEKPPEPQRVNGNYMYLIFGIILVIYTAGMKNVQTHSKNI